MSQTSAAATCPKCRLISPPGAEYCDCGYQFSTGKVVTRPKPRPKYSADPLELERVAFSFKALIGLVGLQAIVAVARVLGVSAVDAPDDRDLVRALFGVVILALGVAAAVQAKRLADALQLASPMGYAIATLFPGVTSLRSCR